MRGALLPLGLVLAAAATAGIALVVSRGSPPLAEPEAIGVVEPDAPPPPLARPATLRPYETTVTLVEDLRDALAGPAATLEEECWRVSRVLEDRARWTLEHLARHEASPKIRALLVLAAGRHVPDEESTLGYLADREAIVRRAAALACGHLASGPVEESFLEFAVPLGRAPSETAGATLRLRERLEEDREVKRTIGAVLRAADVNSRR